MHEKEIELTDRQCEQVNKICEQVDILLQTMSPEYEHDMALVGEIADLAECLLRDAGLQPCYPYMTDEKNCMHDKDCKRAICVCNTGKKRKK